jgi:hypothetical protein
MKLYEISEQYADIQKLVESDDSESMREAIADTMQMVESEFQDKAVAVVSMTMNMEGDIEAINSQIERLQARKKVIQNKIDSFRDYLKMNMESTGISKITCPIFSITLSKPSKVVSITDESLLPDEYVSVKTSVSPDKVKIAAAIKAGIEVEGAQLVDGTSRLTIR